MYRMHVRVDREVDTAPYRCTKNTQKTDHSHCTIRNDVPVRPHMPEVLQGRRGCS